MREKLTHKLWAKFAAVLLLLLSVLLAGGAVLGAVLSTRLGFYTTPVDFYDSYLCEQQSWYLAMEIFDLYYFGDPGLLEDILENEYTPEDTNAHIRLLRGDELLLENEAPEHVSSRSAREYLFEGSGGAYTVSLAVADPLTAADGYLDAYRQYSFLSRYSRTFLLAGGAGLLLAAVSLVFLFCAAGHRSGTEEICLGFFDRIPLDLLLLLCAGAAVLCVSAAGSGTAEAVLVCAAAALLGLRTLLSLAVRWKKGGMLQNTLIRRCAHLVRTFFRLLPLLWKAALVLGAAILGEAILMAGACTDYSGIYQFLLILYNLLLFAAALYGAWQMRRLREMGKALAAGDFDRRLDTKKMYWEFRRHGEDLNSVSAGMAAAVEQRTRSERLKTELITNVSHDIKTPLTSIVSYVDLLNRPGVTEEERQEYLAVLARQAARLKKLTEDLVEASKAATGNVQATLAEISADEMIQQAMAEYGGRLEAAGLTPVVQVEEGLTLLADGRLLWRVLDNLLGNAVKYALAGTRVYLKAERRGDRAVISIRNVSREPLNISEEELMERFVRGDAARTTEGSGLGLNIARSLTAVQKGTLSVTIDGDLFKAEVSLEAAPPQAPRPEGD